MYNYRVLKSVERKVMITLRDYTSTDVERLLELASNPQVSTYLVDTFPNPYTRADAAWWINIGSKEQGIIAKVIEYQDCFVGCIDLTAHTGWRSHIARISYWLGEPYWGKGLGTHAVQAMTDHAFALGYRKVHAPVLAMNIGSMRVLEKCAYHLEGIHKGEVLKNGQYFDVHHYAIHRLGAE